MLDTGILRTCPSHLKRLCCISLRIHMDLVVSRRWSFEIRFGQKILQIRLIVKLPNLDFWPNPAPTDIVFFSMDSTCLGVP
jgi:hypothetical protein